MSPLGYISKSGVFFIVSFGIHSVDMDLIGNIFANQGRKRRRRGSADQIPRSNCTDLIRVSPK